MSLGAEGSNLLNYLRVLYCPELNFYETLAKIQLKRSNDYKRVKLKYLKNIS